MRSRSLPSSLALVLAAGAFTAPAAGAARLKPGDRFAIPAINVTGRLTRKLADGPVLWFHTGKMVAVAGHDVTPVPGYHGHGPFWDLYRVKRGDVIVIGDRRARVRYVLTLRPTDIWPLRSWRGLVLSGCWPRYSAAFRKVVLARWIRP